MKSCSRCKAPVEKSGYCSPCNRDYAREYLKAHPGYSTRKKREWFERNRDRALARERYRYALRSGKIMRQPCEVCGCEKVEGHHDDYSKPLEVRWLCTKHHLDVHGKSRS